MPAVLPPAPIKALLTGAFFVWATLIGLAVAGEPVPVKAVIDGDTVLLNDGTLVRLVGINTPELGKDGAADQPLAREAQHALDQMLAGRTVQLGYESERRDHYGRALAHIVLPEGKDPAEHLLTLGLAVAIAIPPNLGRLERYLKLEAQARARRAGIWGHSYYAPLPAPNLDKDHTGFRFVTGRVERHTRGRYGHYLWLSDHFALHIPHADAGPFAKLGELGGKTVVARGWISGRDGRLRMKLQHPAMLQVIERASIRENSYHLPSPAN